MRSSDQGQPKVPPHSHSMRPKPGNSELCTGPWTLTVVMMGGLAGLNFARVMTTLIIINDPPYGTEKAYNALRLAMALQKDHADVRVQVFLMADAITCALAGQNTPQGYYNLERMLKSVLLKGEVWACGSCMDARGVKEEQFLPGVKCSTMAELAQWTVAADKVLVF
jgi:uncharacterized protein involved in oxidation of intracellular sulfur